MLVMMLGDGELQFYLLGKNNRIHERMFKYIKMQPHYSYTILEENETEYRVDIQTEYGSIFENVVVIKS